MLNKGVPVWRSVWTSLRRIFGNLAVFRKTGKKVEPGVARTGIIGSGVARTDTLGFGMARTGTLGPGVARTEDDTSRFLGSAESGRTDDGALDVEPRVTQSSADPWSGGDGVATADDREIGVPEPLTL
jgi:hypothetical protein